jgi:hypothetical protein
MNALPALTTIATDAIRRQFATTEPPVPDRPAAAPAPSRIRLALAALLERAARAVAPAGYRPAH